MEGISYTADGNIAPSRFVSISAGEDYRVDQADGTLPIVGISQKWLETFDATYHATAGKTCCTFGLGQTGLLQLGGVVSAGDYLKADSNGKGVQASLTATGHQEVGAFALMSGLSDEKIEVRVVTFGGVGA
jgi:hypothetical protein